MLQRPTTGQVPNDEEDPESLPSQNFLICKRGKNEWPALQGLLEESSKIK